MPHQPANRLAHAANGPFSLGDWSGSLIIPSLDSKPAPRVLIVDDEEPIRTFADRVLRDAGYETVVAAGGAEALRIVGEPGAVDLLLTDVAMPEMEGTELAARVRRVQPSIKVLYLTGRRDLLFHDRKALSEDDSFLEKPVSTTALLDSVSLVLFGHRRGL